jgi:AcrR family transcriptional regulator
MSGRDPKGVILDAALATFVENGFDQATVKQICDRAAISNGALFHHFQSKDAIAQELYLRGIASYQDGLLQALEQHGGVRAARAQVRAAVHHHLQWVEAHRDLAWFMYERGRPDWQPAHGAAVRRLNRSTALHIRDWMAPLVTAGAVRELQLPVLIACVVGPAHFVARRWLSGLIQAPPTSFSDALADAAWAALAPHGARGQARRPPMSPAALIEAAALDAALAASPVASGEHWTVAQMTMHATAAGPPMPGAAEPQSVRVEGAGNVILVEVVVPDADGMIAVCGHAVCLRRSSRGPGPADQPAGAERNAQ